MDNRTFYERIQMLHSKHTPLTEGRPSRGYLDDRSEKHREQLDGGEEEQIGVADALQREGADTARQVKREDAGGKTISRTTEGVRPLFRETLQNGGCR